MLEPRADHWQIQWNSGQQILALQATAEGLSPLNYASWYPQLWYCYQYCLQQNGKRVMLYQPDILSFSSWFIALAMAGKQIVLPSDGQPATLSMAAKQCDWHAHELPTHLSAITDIPLTLQLSHDSRVCFFTSGSTGEPKLVDKALCQLLREVQTLNRHFGTQMARAELVAGTVSLQHIYGLLFRLLWPLCANRPVYSEQLSYLEQWQSLLVLQPMIFISSPAHLARFDELSLLTADAGKLCAFFSSGGPLPDEVPARYVAALNTAPIEVYGSTETGGIGFRKRVTDNVDWQAFANIELQQDDRGALAIRSPHLPDGSLFQTEDKVLLSASGSFRLIGRLDRIVKLEEKRLSLPELEQFCLQSDLVAAASALLLQEPRVQLALVVVLSAKGQLLLRSAGKLTLNRLLKQHLLQRFERVLLPRKFRYVQALPYNNQGKLPRAQLEALFQND